MSLLWRQFPQPFRIDCKASVVKWLRTWVNDRPAHVAHFTAAVYNLCVRLDLDLATHEQLWLYDPAARDWLRNLRRTETALSAAEEENARLRERLAELGVSLD